MMRNAGGAAMAAASALAASLSSASYLSPGWQVSFTVAATGLAGAAAISFKKMTNCV